MIKKVFIDESGTNALNTNKGATNFFVLTAVVLNENDVDKAIIYLDEFAKKNCGNAELKSADRIGRNSEKRLKWLTAFCENIPFTFVSLIVNKTKINPDSPFQYKQVFYKSMNRRLLDGLTDMYSIDVYADETGYKEFQDSFLEYLKKSSSNDLFKSLTINFVNSKTNRLVQLADIISGSLPFVFDSSKVDSYSNAIWEVLKQKQIKIYTWPPQWGKNTISDVEQYFDKYDLEEKCIYKAYSLIEKKSSSTDENEIAQSIVLDELLSARTSEGRQTIHGDALIEILEKSNIGKISQYSLRTSIIAKLRDSGVVIAGNNDGYCLAISPEDFETFILHNEGMIFPMLSRLEHARKVILSYTSSFDILKKHPELNEIREKFVNMEISRNLSIAPEVISEDERNA